MILLVQYCIADSISNNFFLFRTIVIVTLFSQSSMFVVWGFLLAIPKGANLKPALFLCVKWIFGVRIGIKTALGFYSSSWTTFFSVASSMHTAFLWGIISHGVTKLFRGAFRHCVLLKRVRLDNWCPIEKPWYASYNVQLLKCTLLLFITSKLQSRTNLALLGPWAVCHVSKWTNFLTAR